MASIVGSGKRRHHQPSPRMSLMLFQFVSRVNLTPFLRC